MKILFIGGTGNISTECAALLHERGHEILVISRGRTAVPGEYASIKSDRKDPAQMRAVAANHKVDVVLNFLGYETSDVELDYEVFKGRIEQYVFISSASVYTKPPKRLPITEDSPLGNRWWDYSQKKLACEQWLLERWKDSGFPVTIVRPSHTYSKLWVPNPVSSSSYTFAARIEQGKEVYLPDDGQNPWTLTSARDFAQGFAGLLGQRGTLGEAFHITSDEVLTWNQICLEIAHAVGVSAPKIVRIPTDFICQVAPRTTGSLKGDKAYPGVFDNAKLRSFVPDFQCKIPFRVGVRESVQWLRQHPEHQNLNPEVDRLIEEVIGAWRSQAAGGV